MQLSDDFRDGVERLVSGDLTADSFIRTYGTHYANAITYGALGKAKKTVTTKEVSNKFEMKVSESVEGSVDGVGLSGGFSYSHDESHRNSSMFSMEDFRLIGGGGATSMLFVNVSDRETVPVRYDLHPIYELISPIFFPTGNDWNKMTAYAQARVKLKDAVIQHMLTAPQFGNKYVGPRFYEVQFTSLGCSSKGDDSSDTINIYGKLSFVYTDDNGEGSVAIFDSTAAKLLDSNDTKKLTCGDKSSLSMSDVPKVMVMVSDGAIGPLPAQYGTFSFDGDGLYEDDNSIDDLDDLIDGFPARRSIKNMTGNRVDSIGGNGGAPTLTIGYTVSELTQDLN
jgi:hypothetical protein